MKELKDLKRGDKVWLERNDTEYRQLPKTGQHTIRTVNKENHYIQIVDGGWCFDYDGLCCGDNPSHGARLYMGQPKEPKMNKLIEEYENKIAEQVINVLTVGKAISTIASILEEFSEKAIAQTLSSTNNRFGLEDQSSTSQPWTTEAPSAEGWYWCKIANDILLVSMRSTANVWHADVHHKDGRVDLYSCVLKVKDALWKGPIKPGV